MTDELKPCPFCGGKAKTEAQVTQMGGGLDGNIDHIDLSIVCEICGTRKTVRMAIRDKIEFWNIYSAMDHVAKEWNTRAGEVQND